jgi:hypothetical protein
MGHTTGVIDIAALDAELIRRAASSDEYQLTLDMRRRVPPGWGPGGSPLGDGGR